MDILHKDSNKEALDLFKTLSDIGKANVEERHDTVKAEFTTGFARFAHLVDKGVVPMDLVLRLTEFFDSAADANVNGRELPALGSGSSNTADASNSAPSNNSGNGAGVQLTDEEKSLLRDFRGGEFKLNPRTGKIQGLEVNAELGNVMQRLEREFNLGYVEGDSPRDRFNRIKAEIDKLKTSASASGSSVDTTVLAKAAGLAEGASIGQIKDRIEELAKRPETKVDTAPIATALGLDPAAKPQDIEKDAKDAQAWRLAAGSVADKVKELTGLTPESNETHVGYVARAIEKGKKRGVFGGRS